MKLPLIRALFLGSCAGVCAAQTVASTQATFKNAAQAKAGEFAAALNPIRDQLRTDLDQLLEDLEAGTLLPSDLPGAYAEQLVTAFDSLENACFAIVQDLDDVGTFLNAELAAVDPDVGTPKGLLIGGEGTLDQFHAKMQASLDKAHKLFAAELRRSLKAVRKALPGTAILTAVVYPLPLLQLADPGLDEDAVESTFEPRVPLFLSAYGDESSQTLAGLSLSTAGNPMSMNVYDADGELLASLPADPLGGGSIYLAETAVEGDDLPKHGNLRVEMFANSGGWTLGIGY